MKEGWTEVPLGDLSQINPREPPMSPDGQVSFVSMAALDPATGTTTSADVRPFAAVARGYSQFRRNDLLVARITPCFENGKIGRATIDHDRGAGSTEFHVVRPDGSRLDCSYALHFLRSPRVRRAGELRMTGSAGQRRVPERFLSTLSVPLPPLDEQRRIADVLDAAESVRHARVRAAALLHELVRALFFRIDLSASPVTTVENLAVAERDAIRTGPFGSQLLHGEFVERGVPVLGIDNVVANEFRWARPRYIPEEKYRRLSRYTVRPGDVLITIMGTCGRVAVVPDDIPTAINTKHLCCITLDRRRCLPEFLQAYFLFDPLARQYLESRSKGAIMSGLNMGIIKELPVRLPSVSVQQSFVEHSRRVALLRRVHSRQLAAIDDLLASLRQRAFAGVI